jgi:hypothetical protein
MRSLWAISELIDSKVFLLRNVGGTESALRVPERKEALMDGI